MSNRVVKQVLTVTAMAWLGQAPALAADTVERVARVPMVQSSALAPVPFCAAGRAAAASWLRQHAAVVHDAAPRRGEVLSPRRLLNARTPPVAVRAALQTPDGCMDLCVAGVLVRVERQSRRVVDVTGHAA